MGQHRTRKDKERAEKIRLRDVSKPDQPTDPQHAYTFTSKDSNEQSSTLLKVDSQYIVKDLYKTVTISSILLMVVIGIYFYLRYN